MPGGPLFPREVAPGPARQRLTCPTVPSRRTSVCRVRRCKVMVSVLTRTVPLYYCSRSKIGPQYDGSYAFSLRSSSREEFHLPALTSPRVARLRGGCGAGQGVVIQ